MSASDEDWLKANQAALFGRLAFLKRELARQAGHASAEAAEPDAEAASGASSLTRLTEAFGLSPFERDILVLCAGMELDAELPALCAAGCPLVGGLA